MFSLKPSCVVASVCLISIVTFANDSSASGPSTAPKSGAAKAPASEAVGFQTVRDRFPEMTDADIVDLVKLKSVIERATPDMFYTATDTVEPKYANYTYRGGGAVPMPGQDPDALANEATVGTPEAPYAVSWGRVGNLYLAQRNLLLGHVAPNTPVLIWKWDKNAQGAFVVTLDGGVYWAHGHGNTLPVQPGLPQADFASPVQHDVLTGKQVKALETAGQFPAGTAQKIEDARTAGDACSLKIWNTKFAAKDKANQTANISGTTRQNRAAAIQQEWWGATAKTCAPQKKRFEAAILSAIAARRDARKALYDQVVAKVRTVAVK
jgi:hypothetical protein